MTNIKEIVLSTGKYLFVTVEKEAANFEIRIDPVSWWLIGYQTIIPLPKINNGEYTFVGKASELSWQEKVSIIEKEHDGSGSLRWWYKLYPAEKGMEQWTRDPDESFDTLLRAYGLNPETTIIIKQQ